MEYSTACNDCIGRAFDILFNGQNMKDEDLVYLDDLSIKVIDLDASPIESQHSLKKLLYEKLSSAGRKSLAKRSIEERSITYKDLKLVSHYINNPRTKQTLLDRGYQQLSSNYNSLPDLVKKDMGKHEILRFPDNIHILHLMMTCHNLKRDSLALKKHLTTKCMDIDANSRYEDLEEEHEECSEMIFSVSPIVEKLNDHIAYAATLYDLYGIWKLEDSDKWNRCILDPTILSHVHPSLIEHSSNTLHKDELQDVNIDSLFKKEDTVSQEAIECSANLPSTIFSELDILDLGQYSLIAEKATESSPLMSDDETTNNDISLQLQPESILESKDKVANKEAIECSANLLSTIFSKLDILDLGQYSLIAEKATESSPLMSDAETTNNDISLQLQPESILESKDKVANKEAIECSANLPSTIFSELDILDLGQYSLIAEKVTESSPLMSDDETTHNDISQGASIESPLFKPELGGQTSLASHQGARPKEVSVQGESYLGSIPVVEIRYQYEFVDFIIKCSHIAKDDMIKRVDNVLNYLYDSDDEEKCNTAISSFMGGHWLRDQYFNLLSRAATIDKHAFFDKRLNSFLRNSYFCNGRPPKNRETKKHYMVSKYNKLKSYDNYIHYVLANNVTPSDAVESCCKDFWLIDQGIFIEHVQALALYLFLGKEAFNQYFSAINKQTEPFSLVTIGAPAANYNRILNLSFDDYELTCKKGTFYTFINHNTYNIRHPTGEFPCMLALCDDASKPPRFCVPSIHKNALIECIVAKLVDEYNNKPYHEQILACEKWDLIGAEKHMATFVKCLRSITMTVEMLKHETDFEKDRGVPGKTMCFRKIKGIKKAAIKKAAIKKAVIEIAIKKTAIEAAIEKVAIETLRLQESQKDKEKSIGKKVQLRQKSKQDSADAVTVSISEEAPKTISATACLLETNSIINQSKNDLISDLQLNVNNVHAVLRRYLRSKKAKKDVLISKCKSLELLHAKIKREGLNIPVKIERHYDDLMKKLRGIVRE